MCPLLARSDSRHRKARFLLGRVLYNKAFGAMSSRVFKGRLEVGDDRASGCQKTLS